MVDRTGAALSPHIHVSSSNCPKITLNIILTLIHPCVTFIHPYSPSCHPQHNMVHLSLFTLILFSYYSHIINLNVQPSGRYIYGTSN